jgi:D-alanyl-D-alanine carboxypeptidase/D-alanyl-D-alanine-endopeptidase (penicillin-binding protein 4)
MEKIKVMLKNRYLTAASSIALLTIITGCAATESPQLASPSPVAESNPPPVKPSQPLIVSVNNPETPTNTKIQQYLNGLTAQGFAKENQGVWIQSGNTLLANHQGTVPLSAASITKVATSLVALQQFGPEHQFITLIGTTGKIENGVLKGDP